MAENDTLLAYLVPKLNSQVENAATDALGHILNKSERCREALNRLLQHGNFNVEPVAKVVTQVTYQGGSRPDMAGYDDKNTVRLLVEAKFWATLLQGQASGYMQLFDTPNPAVLLFIAPRVRIRTLWAEITNQFEAQGKQLETLDAPADMRLAQVANDNKRVMLVSWTELLDSMAALAGDAGVQADIMQLRGLAQLQDAAAFLPIQPEELSPQFVRRFHGFWRVAEAVITQSRGEGWLKTGGFSNWFGGRGYSITFCDIRGWFGVDGDRWARNGDTPFWLQVQDGRINALPQSVRDEFGVMGTSVAERVYIPIRPKIQAEEQAVVAGIVVQLKRIADAINYVNSES